MNKLIAYLVNKIESAYHTARFLLSILKLEFPHARPHRATGQYFRDGVHAGDRAPIPPRSKKGSSRLFAATGAQEGLDNQAETPSDILGFWAGDPLDRFTNSINRKSGGTQGDRGKDLQDVAETKHAAQGSGERDLLTQQDIILDKMRRKQSEFEDYYVFSTHDIVTLCEDSHLDWDLAFDQLIALNKRNLVAINPTYCDRTGKFIGLLWGLK